MFYSFDPWFIVIVAPAILFAVWAQITVKSNFKKYSQQFTKRGMTGAEAAREILEKSGVTGVKIEKIKGNLTDHYDPRANAIRLSKKVHDAKTVAAIGVAAHEAGHAIQYDSHYTPIKIRSSIIPVTRIGSQLAMPLILIGIALEVIEQIGLMNIGTILIYAGIILFAAVALFQLVTLPVEFNASRRAIAALDSSGMLTQDEVPGAKKVLTAAALTYVAALAVALAQLVFLILRVARR